jgi:hypothetical protein
MYKSYKYHKRLRKSKGINIHFTSFKAESEARPEE